MMQAQPAQVIPIPFLGVQEGEDPKALPPGTLTLAENCRMLKPRRLEKRLGTLGLAKALLAGGNILSGKRLLSRGGDDVGIIDGTTLYAYSSDLGKWSTVDEPPTLRVTQRPLVDSARSVAHLDIAIYQNMLVTVYACGYSSAGAGLPVYVKVEDVRTRALLMAPVLVDAAGLFPRVLIRGAVAVILVAAQPNVKALELDLATFVLTAKGNIHTDLETSNMFDAVVVGTELYTFHARSIGTTRAHVTRFDAAYAVLAGPTAMTASDIRACCIVVTAGEYCYAAWSQASDNTVRLATLNPTTLAVVAGPLNHAGVLADYVFVDRYDAANALIGFSARDATPSRYLETQLVAGALLVQDTWSRRRTHWLYAPSKPWKIGSRWYVAATVSVDSNGNDPMPGSSNVVVEIRTADFTGVTTPAKHVATLHNQTGWWTRSVSSSSGGAVILRGYLTKPAVDASGNVYIASAYRDREPIGSEMIPLGFSLSKIDAADDLWRPARLGFGAFASAGAPFYCDGATALPYGFIHAPCIQALTNGIGGSGSMAAGDYYYVAVYEWRDSCGLLHRSIPSPPKKATAVPATGSVTVKVACTGLSSKQTEAAMVNETLGGNPVKIALYRTEVGGTGPFYRLTHEPTDNVVTNDPTLASVTFLDTRADANISPNPNVSWATPLNRQAQIYTAGGELEDVPPPASLTTLFHRGRLGVISLDSRTVFFTKDFKQDTTVAPGFNEVLSLVFDNDKEALAALDEKWVVLGPDSIDVVEGDGPSDTGDQNTWTVHRVQADVGCSHAKSVVTMPDGVAFYSSRGGIEILDRGLNVVWIGKAVEDTLATYPVITSAVLVAEQHEVRWTCNKADGSAGVVVAYDYVNKCWFTRKYNDASDTAAATVAFVDAAMIDGSYTLLTAGGQVYRETSTTFLDGGVTWVTLSFELAWLSFDGPVGWQHIRRAQLLGEKKTNHNLTLEYGFDHRAAYSQSYTFKAAQIVVNNDCPTMRVGSQHGARPKCKAFRIRVTDATPTDPGTYPVGSGQGGWFSALGLEAIPLSGLARHGARSSKV